MTRNAAQRIQKNSTFVCEISCSLERSWTLRTFQRRQNEPARRSDLTRHRYQCVISIQKVSTAERSVQKAAQAKYVKDGLSFSRHLHNIGPFTVQNTFNPCSRHPRNHEESLIETSIRPLDFNYSPLLFAFAFICPLSSFVVYTDRVKTLY